MQLRTKLNIRTSISDISYQSNQSKNTVYKDTSKFINNIYLSKLFTKIILFKNTTDIRLSLPPYRFAEVIQLYHKNTQIMEKTIAPAMTVVSTQIRTTFEKLSKDVGNLPKEIVVEAVQAGLHLAGPQYWYYTWEVCDMEAEFDLKICLPVATFGKTFTNNKFKLERLEEYQHVKRTHLGDWANMKNSYESLMLDLKSLNYIPERSCREVYINCDFDDPSNNITEIQYQVK